MDSGNLAGHLLTLASGLREFPDHRLFSPAIFMGLRDTVDMLEERMGKTGGLAQIRAELSKAPSSLRAARDVLERVTAQANQIATTLESAPEATRNLGRALFQNCEEHLEELHFLAPWLNVASPLAPGPKREPAHVPAEIDAEQNPSAAIRLEKELAKLDHTPTLRELSILEQTLCPLIDEALGELPPESITAPNREAKRLGAISRAIHEASANARKRILALESLAQQSDDLARMDFSFLFDPARELFSIGFNVTEFRRDASFYDLLASEARLCSYVAIAQGQVPQDHWFSMGRLLVASSGEPMLVSWSGSMFEYLMPMLVMPTYENTLLDHTCRAAVQHQIEYCKSRGVPWGISESGYNRTDVHLNYQYRAFGVPGLGLKRGLADDLVIAPYATVMALMVEPAKACENLQRLAGEGQRRRLRLLRSGRLHTFAPASRTDRA